MNHMKSRLKNAQTQKQWSTTEQLKVNMHYISFGSQNTC